MEPQNVSLVAGLVFVFVIVERAAVWDLAAQQYSHWIGNTPELIFVHSPQNFFHINLQLVGWVNVQIDPWGSLVQDGVVAVRYVSIVVRNKIHFVQPKALLLSLSNILSLILDF